MVGSECLQLLSEKDHYQNVIIFTRRKLPDLPNSLKIEQHIVDFDKPDSYRDLVKAGQVICALGTTIKKAGSQEAFYKVDFTYPLEIAKIAYENGVEHFLLVSSNGANPHSKIFYSQVKGEIEAAIGSLGFRSFSIFRPSLLLGKRQEIRVGEKIGQVFGSIFSSLIPGRYKPIHASVVADTILKIGQENSPGIKIIESEEIRQISRGK